MSETVMMNTVATIGYILSWGAWFFLAIFISLGGTDMMLFSDGLLIGVLGFVVMIVWGLLFLFFGKYQTGMNEIAHKKKGE